ncbi:MAG: hypothetical protein KDI68_03225 [Gammaproteobacteria bacterium]|nr:hypothetical protein [Gammaproteobacteria bacterium]
MKKSLLLTLSGTFLLILIPLAAHAWTAELHNGGVISVDSSTNKATIYSDRGTTQLWDGTHQLQDGSVVIVRDGVVTSGDSPQPLPESRQVEPDRAVPAASSTCVELVIKACGFNGECRDTGGCPAARQLMQLEQDEAWQTGSKGPNQTSVKCREALNNDSYFKRCDVVRHSESPTACERLTTSVCGSDNQCESSEACQAAQQLLAMETQERLVSRNPDRPTYTSKQCEESSANRSFFKSCEIGAVPAQQ